MRKGTPLEELVLKLQMAKIFADPLRLSEAQIDYLLALLKQEWEKGK